MQDFLAHLRAAGIRPEQVITDGSPLYPATLAAVWPTAAHQLCLFHQTRYVTKGVLQAVRALRATLPVPPRRRPGQRRNGASRITEEELDYEAGPARVRGLHQQGVPLRSIVRQTGFARNTVRKWVRDTSSLEHREVSVLSLRSAFRSEAPDEVTDAPSFGPGSSPPAPWESWAQVRQISDALRTQRFLFVRRPEH